MYTEVLDTEIVLLFRFLVTVILALAGQKNLLKKTATVLLTIQYHVMCIHVKRYLTTILFLSLNSRASKLLSLIVSLFTSNYVFQWRKFFPDQELLYPPSFDSRIVLYPTQKNLRDYLAWRQVSWMRVRLSALDCPPFLLNTHCTIPIFWEDTFQEGQ